MQTDPTLLRYVSTITEQKKCWELFAQKFNPFQTSRYSMQKSVQTDATCNTQQCCVRLHGAMRSLLFIVEEFVRVVNMLFIIVTSAKVESYKLGTSLRASSPIWASEASLARTRPTRLRRSLALSRETRFTRPNRRACSKANWALEVEFGPFRALSSRQLTFPFCCFQLNQLNYIDRDDVIRTTTALHDFSFLFQVRILQF